MSKYKLYDLKNIPTDNFTMTALELKEFIDFEVKRIYFIAGGKGEHKTGSHAHLKEEDELFIQVTGSSTIVVDEGAGLTDISLESNPAYQGPINAIYVPHLVWHHFKEMSDDCIILAVTSTNYDPSRSDYCEDYQEFQELVKNAS